MYNWTLKKMDCIILLSSKLCFNYWTPRVILSLTFDFNIFFCPICLVIGERWLQLSGFKTQRAQVTVQVEVQSFIGAVTRRWFRQSARWQYQLSIGWRIHRWSDGMALVSEVHSWDTNLNKEGRGRLSAGNNQHMKNSFNKIRIKVSKKCLT